MRLKRINLSLGQSFSLAAWVVIAGVVTSWIVIKQETDATADNLPDIPNFTLTTEPEE